MSKIAVAGGTGRVGRHVVDVLRERGHEVAVMSRSQGVDVITGDGLADAVRGADCIVDAATSPSPDEWEATGFFTTATRNLQQAGEQAGVQRIVVVSIIGIDDLRGGYSVAKLKHERAMLEGPIPVKVLRAAQFHEFVELLVAWGRRGDSVAYLPKMRTQLVAARAVAEALADLATDPNAPERSEIAGPRPEWLVEMAKLQVARRGEQLRVEERVDPADPDAEANASGGLLPGPRAKLAGPTFEEWLDSQR